MHNLYSSVSQEPVYVTNPTDLKACRHSVHANNPICTVFWEILPVVERHITLVTTRGIAFEGNDTV
jgi:hypothetical protein